MEISVARIGKVLLKRIWILILCAVVGLVVAYVYTSYFVTPMYNTYLKLSALRQVDEDETSINGQINLITLAEKRVDTYIELLKVNDFYEMVAQASGTGYSAGQVGSMISYAQVGETGLFTATINGSDPQAVKAVADAVGATAREHINSFQAGATVMVLQQAYLPGAPYSPNVRNNCLIGLFVGLLLSAAVVVLVDLLDTRIKNEDDLTQRYQLPILGTVPDFLAASKKK